MSTKVHCNFYTRAFDVIDPSIRHHGNRYSYTTMRARIWHYPSKISCQYINHYTAAWAIYSRFVTLPVFLIPTTERSTERSSVCLHSSHLDGSYKKSSASYQKVLSRTASKTSRNAGSGVLMQEEATSKEILSTRVKVHRTDFYTVSVGTLRT